MSLKQILTPSINVYQHKAIFIQKQKTFFCCISIACHEKSKYGFKFDRRLYTHVYTEKFYFKIADLMFIHGLKRIL